MGTLTKCQAHFIPDKNVTSLIHQSNLRVLFYPVPDFDQEIHLMYSIKLIANHSLLILGQAFEGSSQEGDTVMLMHFGTAQH